MENRLYFLLGDSKEQLSVECVQGSFITTGPMDYPSDWFYPSTRTPDTIENYQGYINAALEWGALNNRIVNSLPMDRVVRDNTLFVVNNIGGNIGEQINIDTVIGDITIG